MRFYSHGKLLLSGEYLVLKGALSLAVPLKLGQTLEITDEAENSTLSWESYEHDQLWFSAGYRIPDLLPTQTTDKRIANKLESILKAASSLNPKFLSNKDGIRVVTRTGFSLSWGFGSSSGLISNIAWWAQIDPFELHKKVSHGSGYDVICAREDGPVFFKVLGDKFEKYKAEFDPAFKHQIFFIYLGNKQDSSVSVKNFMSLNKDFSKEIQAISSLSHSIASESNLDDFEHAIHHHEKVMASILGRKTLKKNRFPDLEGEIKSLGAWGGDFAMLTWHGTKQELRDYLAFKSIDTVLSFEELIKIR
jgi:mevalonate kinase